MAIWRSLLCVIVTASVAQAEDAALRLRFRTGDAQEYRMAQTAMLELQLAGDNDVRAEVKRVFVFRQTVQSVDPDGAATIVIDITAIELHVVGPGGQKADYDSTSEDEPHGFAATLTPLFQALLAAELTARVTSRGELLDLQIPENLATVLHSKPAGKAVGQLGSVADLESLARLGMPTLPEEADFAVGGQWDDDRTVENDVIDGLAARTTYRWDKTLDVNGEQVASIVPTTTFRFAEPKDDKQAILSTEQVTSGEILFNLSQGRLEKAVYNARITLSVLGADEPTPGMLHHALKVERVSNAD